MPDVVSYVNCHNKSQLDDRVACGLLQYTLCFDRPLGLRPRALSNYATHIQLRPRRYHLTLTCTIFTDMQLHVGLHCKSTVDPRTTCCWVIYKSLITPPLRDMACILRPRILHALMRHAIYMYVPYFLRGSYMYIYILCLTLWRVTIHHGLLFVHSIQTL